MRIMWCWRCKMDLPMLDEGEYAEIQELYSQGFRTAKEFRARFNLPLDGVLSMKERFLPVIEAYERITGMREENPNAILHHRISTYGPPCPRCRKALRTPVAYKCFECGFVVSPRQ